MHRPIRKLQISNPQPYTPQRHDGPVPAALQPVVVPGLAPPTRRPSTEASSNQGFTREGRGEGRQGNGVAGRFESAIPPPGVDYHGRSGEIRAGLAAPVAAGTLGVSGGGGGKPVRPARSTRRAPTSTTSSAQTSYQPEPRPTGEDPQELLSPIRDEPPTPVNQSTGASSWHQDRTHRTELIESQRASERNPPQRERQVQANVVDAFRRGNGTARPGNPKRERTGQGRDVLLRDGESDDVDCEFSLREPAETTELR